jgi:single-strand DNA-binding protein
MQYNHCAFCGYLGRDPEVRYTSNGKAVLKYSIAVTEKWKDRDGNQQESVAWIEGEVWGNSAENFAKYCRKGSNVFVEGRMNQESWDDKNTGKKRTKLVLNTKMWQVLNRNDDGDGRRGNRSRSRDDDRRDSRDRPKDEEPARADSDGGRDRHDDDDDVPF